MEKEFKTIDEQIEILKSRNIKIDNYNEIYDILKKNNYYYLINGYKDLFLNRNSVKEEYVDNTDIKEIYALYNFDKNIKINFLKYILLIENQIDTYISYEFSKNYGHKNYLIQSNFNYLKSSLVDKFINDINKEIKYQYKSSNKMIVHYLDTYKYIPLWILVRILSFGKISKFYSLMKQREQNSISRMYNLQPDDFKVILHNLTIIRNICAHDEKLYDIRLRNRIFSTVYHKKLKISNTNGNYEYATRDLFSIVIILKILLNKDNFNYFYKQLVNDIKELQKSITSVEFKSILDKMGFPENYRKLMNL